MRTLLLATSASVLMTTAAFAGGDANSPWTRSDEARAVSGYTTTVDPVLHPRADVHASDSQDVTSKVDGAASGDALRDDNYNGNNPACVDQTKRDGSVPPDCGQ